MIEKISHHINRNLPFLKGKKLLVAISGGIDSVALTYLLSELDFNISLAHCNFNLRGKESDLDEYFVKKLGEKLDLPVFTTHFNTEVFAKENKQSTQIAARSLRYNWFQKLKEEHSFDYILTAHHADDNLETFLINLTRGSGLDGFTGIPEINGRIVRPLLRFSRKEILTFIKEKKIDWREDKTNTQTKYIRNKIRHKVIPFLKEINPNLLNSFAKTAEYLKESQHIIKDRIKKVASEVLTEDKNTIAINIQKVEKLSNPKAYLYQLLKTYNFTEWNDVYNLLSAQSGKQVLSKTHTLLKDRGSLVLFKNICTTSIESIFIQENELEITKPIHLKIEIVLEKSRKNKETIFIDKEKCVFPLQLRRWQNGDFFYPSGMTGKKKLSKYFKDEKFSLFEKLNTWLLCNNNNDIIWVVGYREDSRYEMTR
ncbi:MAG: tRNA lysidine(34) synthetase TilS, partial [Polaribacter sp.]|nr:tRNA lysidine(34) synthetase TilS [Polaribacter sp.]